MELWAAALSRVEVPVDVNELMLKTIRASLWSFVFRRATETAPWRVKLHLQE
jgi:hypothetical protein